MKGILEQGPIDVDAIIRRAIRSYAMGQIDKTSCDQITKSAESLKRTIANIKEGDE